jgi:protein-tyrosine phosphatase
MERHLACAGCANVRDLGGLRTADGREVRRGAIVRADALDRLTAAGWAALEAHGVRTVVDLRNHDERGEDVAPRPPGLTTLHLPLDGVEDAEFWKHWHGRPDFGTPIYYRSFLDRFPDRTAAVFSAIAGAAPGGVAVHCGIGRDRTGLVVIMLLALAGVVLDDITADYALSEPRVPFGGVGDFYERAGTTPAEVIAALLAALDVESYLLAAGVTREELAAIRERLLGQRWRSPVTAGGRDSSASAAGRPSRPAGATPRRAR